MPSDREGDVRERLSDDLKAAWSVVEEAAKDSGLYNGTVYSAMNDILAALDTPQEQAGRSMTEEERAAMRKTGERLMTPQEPPEPVAEDTAVICEIEGGGRALVYGDALEYDGPEEVGTAIPIVLYRHHPPTDKEE